MAGRVSGVHPRTSREPGLVTACMSVGGEAPGGAELESPRQRSVGHARCRGQTADESLSPRMRLASRRRSRVKTLYRSNCDFARDESRRRIRSEKEEQFLCPVWSNLF